VNGSLHALSGAYVVDALEDDERASFEKHLPGCLDCQREVASLREATALMADDAALDPPASLRSSVLAGIKTIRPLPPETAARPESGDETAPGIAKVLPMRPRRRIATLVAAAAAVAAIVGGAVYQPWQDNGSVTQLTAADQVLAASDAQHHSIEFDDGSSATVVRSMKEGKAVLLTRDMAAPPAGKAFEVWLQDATGTMVPAGMMRTAGDHKLLLEGDAAKATGVGITVEPAAGSKVPTTDPIALFELGKGDA
jgi:anti-sigma-K factor RskA